jgi:WD40 repeat protein
MKACTQAATLLHSCKEHQDEINCVAVSGDSKLVASASDDETIKIWNIDTGVCICTIRCRVVWCLKFSKDSTTLVTGGHNGKSIKVWAIKNGQTVTLINTLMGHTSYISSVAFSADGLKIASGSCDRTVKIWCVQSQVLLKTLEGHKDTIRSVTWSPDSTLVASGGDDKTVCLWDPVAGTQVMEPLRGHDKHVRCVKFSSSTAKVLVSCSEDNTILLWDLQSTSATVRHKLRGHTAGVITVSLSPDDRFLVSGSRDRNVCVWDLTRGTQISKLEGHTDSILSVAWSCDGKYIVSGCLDRTVCIWKVAEQVCSSPLHAGCLTMSESWCSRLLFMA